MGDIDVEAVDEFDETDSIPEQLRTLADDMEELEDEDFSLEMAGISLVIRCMECDEDHFSAVPIHMRSDALDDFDFTETMQSTKAFNKGLNEASMNVGIRDEIGSSGYGGGIAGAIAASMPDEVGSMPDDLFD